jgi:UDP-N-acetylglucosamine 1-carboxyvinyltransferase
MVVSLSAVPVAATDVIRVRGGRPLAGTVQVAGAKNSALKLMAAALLAPGRTALRNVPTISDISIMSEVLRRLGCGVQANSPGHLTIDVPQQPGTETDADLVRQLRASICVLGPLLARYGHVRVALPGGDAIGSRGLDMHVTGLTQMGAEISAEPGFIVAAAPRGLRGTRIALEFPSVGATENLLMAAVLAAGITEIDNAAREPEIVDIAAMLTGMGARIGGAGSSAITIDGVAELKPTVHQAIGDRIVAGTWAFGAAMTRGDVTVQGVDPRFLDVALEKVGSAGAMVQTWADGFRVSMTQRPTALDIVTLPFPGFATDLMPMAIGLAAVSEGASMITENIFDGRFSFVQQMLRLGAQIRIDGKHAVVRGKERLSAAPVLATDIRAGAGLVIASLCADGLTEVSQVHHIDRGYPNLVADLQRLGAHIDRVPHATVVPNATVVPHATV